MSFRFSYERHLFAAALQGACKRGHWKHTRQPCGRVAEEYRESRLCLLRTVAGTAANPFSGETGYILQRPGRDSSRDRGSASAVQADVSQFSRTGHGNVRSPALSERIPSLPDEPIASLREKRPASPGGRGKSSGH